MNQQTDYQYDVFISYSSQDKTWVRGELLQRLEDSGIKVCIDFRDFIIGMPAIKNMEQAVLTSRKTVLVLTPAYLQSSWTEFENLIVQTLDPNNQSLRIITLMKEKCKPSLRINYLTYVNFADPDDPDLAWHQLLGALR